MKNIILCAVLAASIINACKTPAKTNTGTAQIIKDTLVIPRLNTLEDSASYAIGLSVVNFYKQQGATTVNNELVAMAINDAQSGKKLLLDDAQANQVIMAYLNKQQALKSKPVIDSGENFLAANAKRPGVITTPSGLQYEILRQGTGPKPTIADTVSVHYKGTFINGTGFDESYSSGNPIEFGLKGVIRGWTEVLQLMPVGSKYKVYVPYKLGYGANDYYSIPGGSLLIFEMELLGIKGK